MKENIGNIRGEVENIGNSQIGNLSLENNF
jgi:hypothetical protein